jgi:hypothetical protein
MVALVAALLVATGGSPRTVHHRASASSGQAGSAPHAGRHVASLASASYDQPVLHLDLASTPPADVPQGAAVLGDHVDDRTTSFVSGDRIAAVGRGPPTA